jgi:hypothetical protein
MSNSIRTPRQGKSKTSRRIAAAVDDEEWQQFRLSLKGISTQDKLDALRAYYEERAVLDQTQHSVDDFHQERGWSAVCWVCIRIDNYLKALARGGQLERGVSLKQALAWNWNFKIRK